MRHAPRARVLIAFSVFATALFASTPAHAFEDKRACCRIIRVDLQKNTAWLRNPRTALVVEFRLGPNDRELFKVGDLYNPETADHNGEKLDRTFALGLPHLDPYNAKILRVRGHEFAAKDDASDLVYRSRTLRFDNVLSSIRPGDPVYVDREAGWFFIEMKAYGNVKPSLWAYKLE